MSARTTRVADVAPEAVRWLWGGRIPCGLLSELTGDPGAGKSTLVARIAAHITNGTPLPGDTDTRAPGNVLLLSAEDGVAHTIRPRLDAADADVTRVHMLDGIVAGDALEAVVLRDAAHLDDLHEAIQMLDISWCVIDPVSAYIGDVDTHRDSDVRAVLAQLGTIAAGTGCAVTLIRHLRKSGADKAIYRAGGSIAFVAAARVQMLAGSDPDDEQHRALCVTKSNLAPLAPAIGYTLADGCAHWTGESDLTAGRLLSAESSGDEASARDDAVTYLRATLAAGPQPAGAVQAGARRLGISDRTLKRARASLGVQSERVGGAGQHGTWTLSLRGPTTLALLTDEHVGPLSTTPTAPTTNDPSDPLRGPTQTRGPLSPELDGLLSLLEEPS